MGFVSVYRVGSYKIAVVEDRIIELSTEVRVGGAKKVVTGALPNRVGNADDNVNNSGTMPISWLDGGTNLLVDSGIVKLLTKTRVENTEKILTGALPGKIEDIDDVAAGWGLER